MLLKLFVFPPLLVRWLDENERRKRVLLFDLDIDMTEKDRVRFDFDLVFSPKSVRRGALKRSRASSGRPASVLVTS